MGQIRKGRQSIITNLVLATQFDGFFIDDGLWGFKRGLRYITWARAFLFRLSAEFTVQKGIDPYTLLHQDNINIVSPAGSFIFEPFQYT